MRGNRAACTAQVSWSATQPFAAWGCVPRSWPGFNIIGWPKGPNYTSHTLTVGLYVSGLFYYVERIEMESGRRKFIIANKDGHVNGYCYDGIQGARAGRCPLGCISLFDASTCEIAFVR